MVSVSCAIIARRSVAFFGMVMLKIMKIIHLVYLHDCKIQKIGTPIESPKTTKRPILQALNEVVERASYRPHPLAPT